MDLKRDSLYEYTRVRLLEEVLGEVSNKSAYSVLVADDYVLSILYTALTMYDLTQKGITAVETLQQDRQPLPSSDAVYILTPTSNSLSRLFRDFTDEPYYNSVHLYFLSPVSQSQMSMLANSEVAHRIVTFKEVNLDYKLLGPDAFSLEKDQILQEVYARDPAARMELSQDMARQLADLCICLGQAPIIRYWARTPACRELAEHLEVEMQNKLRLLNDPKLLETRCTLVILDRSYDFGPALAHSVYYEAMLKDFYKIGPEGNVRYQSADNTSVVEVREAVLNEEDAVWATVRYKEIDVAQAVLREQFSKFREENKAIEAAQKERLHDVQEVGKVLKGLSAYRVNADRYAAHFYLIEQCMNYFTETISPISEIEQILLTGCDSDLREVSPGKIIDKVVNALKGIQKERGRLRLCILTHTCLKVSAKDQQRMTVAANFSSGSLTVIRNLGTLNLLEDIKSSTLRKTKDEIKAFKAEVRSVEKVFNYAVPQIVQPIKAVAQRQLSKIEFPPTRLSDGLEDSKSVGVSLRKRQNRGGSRPAGQPKTIFFILGGVTYSEIRLVENLRDVNLILGGSSLLSAYSFMDNLEQDGGLSSRDINPYVE